MSSPVVLQSTLRFASRLSPGRSGSVSVCGLSPELVISLAGCEHFGGPLKSVFRVRVAALTSEEDDCLPDVSGRFCLRPTAHRGQQCRIVGGPPAAVPGDPGQK